MNKNEQTLRETLNKYIDEYDKTKATNTRLIKAIKNIANGNIGRYSCAEEYASEILKGV